MLCEKDASHRVIALSWMVSGSSSWFAFVKIVLFILVSVFIPLFLLVSMNGAVIRRSTIPMGHLRS